VREVYATSVHGDISTCRLAGQRLAENERSRMKTQIEQKTLMSVSGRTGPVSQNESVYP
jgi:hypothetical protein